MSLMEIAGDLALVGDDNDLYADIAGEDPVDELLAVAGARAIKRAQAVQIAKARAVVTKRPPTAARNGVLGFGPQALAAGGTATVNSAPQRLFRGERIGIPSDIAGSIRVTGIVVGADNQLPNANSIPGRAFDERGNGMELVMDTAQPNSPISIAIVNTSLAAVTFEAWIRGTVVR